MAVGIVCSLLSQSNPLSPGQVNILQKSLNTLGHNSGEPDSQMGAVTSAAIIDFLKQPENIVFVPQVSENINKALERYGQGVQLNILQSQLLWVMNCIKNTSRMFLTLFHKEI